MESGLRGYAINGKEEMLAPWSSGKEEFVEVLRESKSFTSDNPAQQDRLNNFLQQ
jgi:methyl-accepting chemotaxis protein